MLPPVMTMGRSGSRKGNIFFESTKVFGILWQFNLYFCAISFGILALFWSVFLLHKIYGAQIGALVNNAVEIGEKLTELRDG